MRLFIRSFLLLTVMLTISCEEQMRRQETDSFAFPEFIDSVQAATSYYSPAELTFTDKYILTVQKAGTVVNLGQKTAYDEFVADDHDLSDTANKSVHSSNGIRIFVDTTREVSVNIDERMPPPFPFDQVNSPLTEKQKLIDSISSAERYSAWKNSQRHVKAMPLYIVNPTAEAKRISIQDRKVLVIQEALDSNGRWQPIEYWRFSTCGNSYFGLILQPGSFLVTKLVKYKGSFETMLRLKMLNGREIIYSTPFRGSINPAQLRSHPGNKKYKDNCFFNSDEQAQ